MIFGDFKTNQSHLLNLSNELTQHLKSSDINVVNFEAPVNSSGKPISKSGPNISQNIKSADWLIKHNFTAISLANNHIMDFGIEGLIATKKQFSNITTMGAGTWNDAYKCHIFIANDGIKVGIICCTHCEFGTLTDKFSQLNDFGCAWILNTQIQNLISTHKNEVDCLIVMPHGGIEYMEQPLPEWREVYKMFIDLGADAVIASHPHIPQGWEIYKNKPICYSLGNFCFEWSKAKHVPPKHWFESLCCNLEISTSHHINIEIIPIFFNQNKKYIYRNTTNEFSNYLKRINKTLKDDNEYITYVNNYVNNIFPFYIQQFTRSGWNVNILSKGFLKGLAEGFLGRGFFKLDHAINNIQCESHRWAILREINNRRKRFNSSSKK